MVLRLVADHAQMWNGADSPEEFKSKSAVLDDWCARIGRDPKTIERSANVARMSPRAAEEWLQAGLQHFVLRLAHKFDTKPVERMLKLRDS